VHELSFTLHTLYSEIGIMTVLVAVLDEVLWGDGVSFSAQGFNASGLCVRHTHVNESGSVAFGASVSERVELEELE
jgi:hypothetical protein